jgi:copper chaperone NosL
MRFAAIVLLLTACAAAHGGLPAAPPQVAVPKPGPKDLCPVCGMLVSKYTNWAATVVWRDGHAHHFDGAKDMFKFLQGLPRYAPGRRREDVRAMFVTEFYNLARVEAGAAYYVTGSDVMGPMGHELVPLASAADARDFLADHKGKRILKFDEVTAGVVSSVDQGKF